MDVSLLILAAGLLSLLLGFLLLSTRTRRQKNPSRESGLTPQPKGPYRSCPLCGELLQPGQKVRSSVFATATADKIMEIYGCPFCDEAKTANPPQKRHCPVCHQILRPGEVVTARVFERQDGRKTHVHVLGCPRCRSRSS
ncbi:MAG: hypothetical protein HKM05_07060 [Spirochaetales bacterium]|nr:hypothetical protein [Spirochaetales bacterium]